MDLAKSQVGTHDFSRIYKWVSWGANIWLIYHLLVISQTGHAQALFEYKLWRSRFYAGYAALLICFGMLSILNKKSNWAKLIPQIVVSVIVTTFSFTLAGFTLDIYYFTHILLASDGSF